MHRQHARSLSALSHHRMRPGCASLHTRPPFPLSIGKNFPRSVKKTLTAPHSSMKAGGTRHKPRHGHGRDAPPAPAADTAGSSLPQRLEPRKKEIFTREREKSAASAEQLHEGGRLPAQTTPPARPRCSPCSGRRHGRQFPASAAGAQEKRKIFPEREKDAASAAQLHEGGRLAAQTAPRVRPRCSPCSGRRHGRQFPVSAAGAQEKRNIFPGA